MASCSLLSSCRRHTGAEQGGAGPRRAVSVSSFSREFSRVFCDFVLSALSAKSVLSFSSCFVEHDSFSVASGGCLPCGRRFQGIFIIGFASEKQNITNTYICVLHFVQGDN